MLDKTGLSASKTSILPKNYHISVYWLSREAYTGAVIRYAITDRTLFSPKDALRLRRPTPRSKGQAELIRRCGELARLGVDFIQLREKDLPPGELIHLGKAILESIRAVGSHTRLLINVSDDLQPALSIGADGLHLTSQSRFTPANIRRQFQEVGMSSPFVSVSCHRLDEVKRARALDLSAILFGPVFGKVVQGEPVHEGIGLDRLAEACTYAMDVPVLALGGITEANAAACMNAGAAGVAAIRMFMLP